MNYTKLMAKANEITAKKRVEKIEAKKVFTKAGVD